MNGERRNWKEKRDFAEKIPSSRPFQYRENGNGGCIPLNGEKGLVTVLY